MQREVRIPQIARIAEDLFGRFGYQGTSMDDVARLAGVSKPVVYDLVGSKEELFQLSLARSAEEMALRVAGAVEAAAEEDRLRAGALAFFQFVDEHRPAWRGLLAAGSAPLTAEMAEIRRTQAALVAGLLIQGVSSGHTSGSSGPVSATDQATTGADDAASDASATDQVIADALANAINGAFEALAGWWHSHETMSADDLADLMVQLMGPGLEAMAGSAAGAMAGNAAGAMAGIAAGPKGAE
ncbi:MAG TPA: TetR/AcrR family transcriptional regulator [Acidimicrobiales bacterium]